MPDATVGLFFTIDKSGRPLPPEGREEEGYSNKEGIKLLGKMEIISGVKVSPTMVKHIYKNGMWRIYIQVFYAEGQRGLRSQTATRELDTSGAGIFSL